MGQVSIRFPIAAMAGLLCLALSGCQKSSPSVNATPEPAPVATPAPVAESAPATVNHLPPAEEKRLTDMAKSRRAGDGAAIAEVLQYAEQHRPDKFKVATIDVDYARDSTPTAVTVCYWIGNKRLDGDLDCKSIGWDISADKAGLKPYAVAATQALEGGRDSFLRSVDQMYAKSCGADGKLC